jgi:protein O-GlcNAc transferase
LPELVTANLPDYIALAETLARDPSRLHALRRALDTRKLSQPLFDTARFTQHLEAAYITMAKTWQRGDRPKPLSVAPIA